MSKNSFFLFFLAFLAPQKSSAPPKKSGQPFGETQISQKKNIKRVQSEQDLRKKSPDTVRIFSDKKIYQNNAPDYGNNQIPEQGFSSYSAILPSKVVVSDNFLLLGTRFVDEDILNCLAPCTNHFGELSLLYEQASDSPHSFWEISFFQSLCSGLVYGAIFLKKEGAPSSREECVENFSQNKMIEEKNEKMSQEKIEQNQIAYITEKDIKKQMSEDEMWDQVSSIKEEIPKNKHTPELFKKAYLQEKETTGEKIFSKSNTGQKETRDPSPQDLDDIKLLQEKKQPNQNVVEILIQKMENEFQQLKISEPHNQEQDQVQNFMTENKKDEQTNKILRQTSRDLRQVFTKINKDRRNSETSLEKKVQEIEEQSSPQSFSLRIQGSEPVNDPKVCFLLASPRVISAWLGKPWLGTSSDYKLARFFPRYDPVANTIRFDLQEIMPKVCCGLLCCPSWENSLRKWKNADIIQYQQKKLFDFMNKQ